MPAPTSTRWASSSTRWSLLGRPSWAARLYRSPRSLSRHHHRHRASSARIYLPPPSRSYYRPWQNAPRIALRIARIWPMPSAPRYPPPTRCRNRPTHLPVSQSNRATIRPTPKHANAACSTPSGKIHHKHPRSYPRLLSHHHYQPIITRSVRTTGNQRRSCQQLLLLHL